MFLPHSVSRACPSSTNNERLCCSEMSAAEYREKLKTEKARKRDPRQERHMSMQEKHAYIDRL